MTTISAASAAVRGMSDRRAHPMAVRTLQEYQAGVDRSSAADHRADEPGAASDQRG